MKTEHNYDDPDCDHIFYSPFFRISWNYTFSLGCGFDFEYAIFGIFLGPVSLFIGYDDE